MIVLNPFQRRRYTLRTLLSPEEASRRLLDTMNDYNTTARGRFLMATAFGERFSAKIEPGTLGSSGSGVFLKHFVVEANGLFRPTRDGAIDLTIGFRRSTSLGQVLIR